MRVPAAAESSVRDRPAELSRADAARLRAAGSRRDPELTRQLARTAVACIASLELPGDPPSFELWYEYASGRNPALNASIDQAFDRDGALTLETLDRIRHRFLSSAAAAARVSAVGGSIDAALHRLVGLLDDADAAAASYAADLNGVSAQLGGPVDLQSLRAIVATLIRATGEVEEQNHELRISLAASREEIGQLQVNLKEISAESLTDSLTALANRRHFDQALARAVAEARANRAAVSLLLCDIDHFKRFNDRFGHTMGDHVLRLIGSTLKRMVRETDFAARYGGEEFAIILPNTSCTQALTVAESLRKAIASRPLVSRSSGERLGMVTVSIGVAELRPGETALALIDRADAHLYAAKRAGRNTVAHAPSHEQESADWQLGIE